MRTLRGMMTVAGLSVMAACGGGKQESGGKTFTIALIAKSSTNPVFLSGKQGAEAAAADGNNWLVSKYDAVNPPALKRLLASGTQLRAFPREVMEACYKAAVDTYAEISGTNENFKKIHDAYMAFRNEEYLWFQIGDYTYDNFMIRQRAKG